MKEDQKKKMFLASTINSMKILGLKVRFQMYFKLSHDFTLLEELVTVSSTVKQGFFPPPKSHTQKIKLKKHVKPAERVTSGNYFKVCISNKSAIDARQHSLSKLSWSPFRN